MIVPGTLEPDTAKALFDAWPAFAGLNMAARRSLLIRLGQLDRALRDMGPLRGAQALSSLASAIALRQGLTLGKNSNTQV